MLISSPIPVALLQRLESLQPRPLTRELNHVEKGARIAAMLVRAERHPHDWRARRVADLVSMLRQRKAVEDLA